MQLLMLNNRPIIVNGFSRGGTTILINLLLSHPDTAMPTGELHAVFKGRTQIFKDNSRKINYKKIFYDLPIRLISRQDIFRRNLYKPRDIPNKIVLKYIDWILYKEKQKALGEFKNRWKDQTTRYTREELIKSRVTLKAFDGLIFTNDIFRKMYPDARFVAIIRNGLALCEGRMRRGHSKEKAANEYNLVCNEILRNLSNPDFLCIKFEDILSEPLKSIQKIYTHCDLDIKKCNYFRLKHRSIISKEGKSILQGDRSKLNWYTVDELKDYFVPEVNQNQIARLKESDLEYLKYKIGPTMEKFNYYLEY